MEATSLRLVALLENISSQLNTSIDRLSDTMTQLKKKVSNISHKVEPETLVEDRFTHIDFEDYKLSKVEDPYTHAISLELKVWIGNLVSTVFSNGFKMFEEEKMNNKRTKAYCAENILYNLIQLIRQNQLTSEHLQQMNEFMRDELINYLIEKYPKSEEKEFNIAFANRIKPIENLENNENDLVYRSKVVFDFHRDGNYNPTIMKFLNYVISLPDEQIELGKEE